MAQPSIKKNYIYNTLYEILAIISPLITAPYVSRIFEADGVGIYSYTNAITSYFTMFAALGVKSYGQREIAQHRDNKQECSKLFWELEIMCISTTLICLLVWVMLIIFSNSYSIYYMILTMTVVATAFDISWFWGGQEQYKFIVIRNSIIKIAGIILLFTFVHKKSDLLLYIALIAGTGLLGNISMWSYLPKFLTKVDFRSLNVKRHYKETMIYFIPTIATSIYTMLDKAMIGWITNNDSENGYYEQATKIIHICKTIVFSINTVVSSRMSYLFIQKKHDEILKKMKTTMNFIFLIATPIVFGLIGVSSNFVPIFFGKGYEKTVTIIMVMAPLLIIIGISNCLGSLYFTPSGQRARSNKAIITGAVINLICNSFLIYLFASIGAAIASVIAEMTITLMYIFMAKDFFSPKYIISFMWKRITAATVMLAAIIAIGLLQFEQITVLVIQICGGAAIYFIMLLVLKDKFMLENIQKYLGKFISKLRKN